MANKIQMALGALIIPIGLGIAGYDLYQQGSIELGGECSDSDHCQSGTCLEMGESGGVCVSECDFRAQTNSCPASFVCAPIDVTYQMGTTSADMGTSGYCVSAATVATAPAQ